MISISLATSEADVVDVARACYPAVDAGQVGFGLAGQGSLEALTATWLRLLQHPGDMVLIARDGVDVVGACGILVSDASHLQTVNGPVALRDHAEVFDAVVRHLAETHPDAELLVGVSHRHEPAMAWAATRGELLEHTWPYQGIIDTGLVGSAGRAVTDFEKDRFCALYDATVGVDMWWTSARIRKSWTEWLCVVVDDAWEHVLAARLFPEMSMTEAFGISVDAGPSATTTLMSAWLREAALRGIRKAVIFAENPAQRGSAEALGLRCADEYYAWRIAWGADS